MRIVVLLAIVLFSGVSSFAQKKEIIALTKDVWIIEKTCFSLGYNCDSCSTLQDAYYQFTATDFKMSGYPNWPAVVGNRRGFILSPIDGKPQLIFMSCPDIFGFINGGGNRKCNIIVAGEHPELINHFEMQTDSTFTLNGEFPDGEYGTRYYKRIPTPEALKQIANQ